MKYIGEIMIEVLKSIFCLSLFNFIAQKITTLINHKKITKR